MTDLNKLSLSAARRTPISAVSSSANTDSVKLKTGKERPRKDIPQEGGWC